MSALPQRRERASSRLESLRAVVFRQALPPGASIAERDVLAQVEAVESALRSLGCATTVVECDLDLSPLRRAIQNERPDFVFELVESLGGSDRLAPVVAAFLETLRIPTTGSSFAAWSASNDKLRAKRILRDAGLPTPDWWTVESFDSDAPAGTVGIVKSTVEHASLGIDDRSVVVAGTSDLESTEFAADRFVEAFIDGREFNLSLLASDDGQSVEVLPSAEIAFVGFPPGKPRIVGYAAKWDEDSFEYGATPRRFDFPAQDEPLLDELRSLALACWNAFGLGGYARVDFRVDETGRPWILEANANPCLAPDAGFAAALSQAGVPFEEAVWRIVGAARASAGSTSPRFASATT